MDARAPMATPRSRCSTPAVLALFAATTLFSANASAQMSAPLTDTTPEAPGAFLGARENFTFYGICVNCRFGELRRPAALTTYAPPIVAPSAQAAAELPDWDDYGRSLSLYVGGGYGGASGAGAAADYSSAQTSTSASTWLRGEWTFYATGTGKRFRFDLRLSGLVAALPEQKKTFVGSAVQACVEWRMFRNHGLELCPLAVGVLAERASDRWGGLTPSLGASLGWVWHVGYSWLRAIRLRETVTVSALAPRWSEPGLVAPPESVMIGGSFGAPAALNEGPKPPGPAFTIAGVELGFEL